MTVSKGRKTLRRVERWFRRVVDVCALLVLLVFLVQVVRDFDIRLPRFGGGSTQADSTLTGNLMVLRKAIDLYAAEHGGDFPPVATISSNLTQYTDDAGVASVKSDRTHMYGPYVRSVPVLTVGKRKGASGIGVRDGDSVGWIYDAKAGAIRANTTNEKDADGRLYSEY